MEGPVRADMIKLRHNEYFTDENLYLLNLKIVIQEGGLYLKVNF